MTEAIATGGYITLYDNVTYSTDKTVAKNLTMNLNNHTAVFGTNKMTVAKDVTLSVNGGKVTAGNVVPFVVNGTLVLENVTATTDTQLLENNGTVTITNGTYTTEAKTLSVIENKGTLTVTNAKFVAQKLTTGSLVNNAGTVTMTNLDVDTTGALLTVAAHGSKATLAGGLYDATAVVKTALSAPPASHGGVAATVTINGGTYNTTGTALYANYGMSLNVTGGTITSKDQGLHLYDATAVISGGTINSTTATVITTGAGNASLTVSGGTLKSEGSYPLYFQNNNATYAISGGTFEAKIEDRPAIMISNLTTIKDGKTEVAKAYKGILTGGKYLNNIIAGAIVDNKGATVDVTNDLVAEGYTVKEEGNYKVVVSTKAENDKKPAAKPEEQAPNTYDAGLVYMGLALSAIGASVVSVRKYKRVLIIFRTLFIFTLFV